MRMRIIRIIFDIRFRIRIRKNKYFNIRFRIRKTIYLYIRFRIRQKSTLMGKLGCTTP